MSRKLAFVNAKVYTPNYVANTVVLTAGSQIEKLVSVEDYQSTIKPTQQYQEVDCKGHFLSPGFIDLQVNGCGGVNFSETVDNLSKETLMIMHNCNVKHGCTTFLPTLITNPIELREHALKLVQGMHEQDPNVKSYIPGLHIEGPHISLIKKGTHNPKFIAPMKQEDLDLYLSYAPYIKMLTLAPEENDLNLVKKLVDANILVSMGHTNATYEEAKRYIDEGVHTATHLYNAMTSIANGRTPGVIGAIYTDQAISPGIITDGVHVNWSLVNLSLEIKKDKIFVVTDAVAPAGTDIKEFIFANKLIKVINEGCYDENGGLSGSAITMDSALRRLKANTKLSLPELLTLVTVNPARQIRASDELGSIKPGAYANLTVFDNDFNIQATYVNGEQVYKVA